MPLTTDKAWAGLIKSVKANNPGWGAKRIAREVQAEGERRGLSNPPHERTVGRILRREWDPLATEQQAQYRSFYWPESLERGDLPWEASFHCLELLSTQYHLLKKVGSPDHPSRWQSYARPSIRLCRCFWRISMAAPDLELGWRHDLAKKLALWEAAGDRPEDFCRGIEGYFIFAPWRSPKSKQKYDKAIAEKSIPTTDQIPKASPETRRAYLEELVGPHADRIGFRGGH